MPLQATSGAASYDAFGGGAAAVPNYIEDVFSTYLYTGSSGSQTINNGIDLLGKGGLVWFKPRNIVDNHYLSNTATGITNSLLSNSTDAQTSYPVISSVLNNGYVDASGIGSSTNLVSWTFRKQSKFFSCGTYTGNDVAGRAITHDLGSVPGCIIVKNIDSASGWFVYHRSLGASNAIRLDSTIASFSASLWNSTTPTSTEFYIDGSTNVSGERFVYYIFAHDAGGFGLTGTDNVISCGSYTGNGSSTGPVVTLGYEPQWLMIKRATGTSNGNWVMLDVMRGFSTSTDNELYANLSIAEGSGLDLAEPQATGFQIKSGSSGVNASGSDYIYIAIRRGPMKVPTDATKVFYPQAYADSSLGSSNPTNLGASAGFPADFFMHSIRSGDTFCADVFDRMRGSVPVLSTSSTAAESTSGQLNGFNNAFDIMSGVKAKMDDRYYGSIGRDHIGWFLRRAPSFFDEVCYTDDGTGSLVVNHNLQAVPELAILKKRSGTGDWDVSYTNTLQFNLNTDASAGTGALFSALTSTTFTAPGYASGSQIIVYLFATCAGVSKVFSYTGNGSSQTINCGFTGGARFVLIKRRNATGDWYVWDTARGIIAGSDPHLSLNSTAAEVTSDDSIDTDSTGFIVNQLSATNINVSSSTYIGIAIA